MDKTKTPTISVQDLSSELQMAIAGLQDQHGLEEVGIVTRVGDGVVWIYGLRSVGFNEVITIEGRNEQLVEAFALNLDEDEVGAVLLGDETLVSAGAKVRLKGEVLSVPVGEELLGRVINPLGHPLDGLGPLKATKTGHVERAAPGVIDRKEVHEPLMTGIAAIDALVPIGRGQRELIIGDRQTGKTAIAVDTMINQGRQKSDVVNVYVAIGQKQSKVSQLVERLKAEGVMQQTIVVVAGPSDPASLLYIAPYAGTAMAEYFRDNKGHALIIYDDLSKHAAAYRQMSLLLRRPPGREAYPGDVFYLHSRLLERSAKLSEALGSGSLTALPIVETQANDIAAYIPTNVISITDGQIFLETDLFYQGVRPAISVGLSVSRVGGKAQTKALKSVGGRLKLELAQFRELAAFAQFGTDLDDETKQRITRGERLTELLKQPQYEPLGLWEQVALLLVAGEGVFDPVPLLKLKTLKHAILSTLNTDHAKAMEELDKGVAITDDHKNTILQVARKAAQGLGA